MLWITELWNVNTNMTPEFWLRETLPYKVIVELCAMKNVYQEMK